MAILSKLKSIVGNFRIESDLKLMVVGSFLFFNLMQVNVKINTEIAGKQTEYKCA